ncbi:MAG: glycosyl hydrolase 115 family protein [Bacteroidota bacterium]
MLGITISLLLCRCSVDKFNLVSGDTKAVIVVSETETPYINKAIRDLVSDIHKITGKRILVQNKPVNGSSNLIIATIGQTDWIHSSFEGLEGEWETYSIKTSGKDLIIAGSNPRGTMFGIYWFIENHLGVDPFYWWKDMEPEQKKELVFGKIDYTSAEPDFKFRGWFINDEDLLTSFKDGGGVRKLDYPFYQQVVHPNLAERVFEAAVRLRYNLIIPASFIEIFNPAEEKLLELASTRGLYLSQHHVEPMGVSAFGYFNYWERKTGEIPLFSYYSEKDKVIEVWKESAKRWSKYPDVIWQIGLRGIADRPMWMADPGVPQSDEERAALISEAMQTQMEILKELRPGEKPKVTTTLWGEGAVFNEMGLLTFPENTTIVFADNSPGWIMQKDFYETKREPEINYGIYYHHQLIGAGPHLAQAVPPSKTHEIFSLARDKDSDYYSIINVGNVREFVLGIEASRDILENTYEFEPDTWLKEWCVQNYSVPTTKQAYDKYFESFVVDDEYGTPLLLDGLSRGRTAHNLNFLRKTLENIPDNSAGNNFFKQDDAFWKSLQSAHPGGDLSYKEWLNKAEVQDSILNIALDIATTELKRLSENQKLFFENNLIAHILFMQCLTGMVVESTKAVISLQDKDLEDTKKHLEAAVSKFDYYEEAVRLGSRGKWQNWYLGETKINVKRLRNDIQNTLNQLNKRRNL